MLNSQKPEPFNADTGDVLDLHSIWHTIQGEGIFSGYPAFFIRLAGCNLQCPMCDTDYTSNRRTLHVVDICRALNDLVDQHPTTALVVITGGEPFRQMIGPLCKLLADHEFSIQIESNGVLPPSPDVLHLIIQGKITYCVSPKTSKVCDETKYATFFKYVISSDNVSGEDGLPIKALDHPAKPRIARPPAGYQGPVYVNPMNAYDTDKNFQNLMAARDSSLRFGYTVGVQLHLLLNLP